MPGSLPWGHIRLVGQLVHGRGDWDWLRTPAAPGSREGTGAEDAEESGTETESGERTPG